MTLPADAPKTTVVAPPDPHAPVSEAARLRAQAAERQADEVAWASMSGDDRRAYSDFRQPWERPGFGPREPLLGPAAWAAKRRLDSETPWAEEARLEADALSVAGKTFVANALAQLGRAAATAEAEAFEIENDYRQRGDHALLTAEASRIRARLNELAALSATEKYRALGAGISRPKQKPR